MFQKMFVVNYQMLQITRFLRKFLPQKLRSRIFFLKISSLALQVIVMEHEMMIGKLCNDKIELDDWPIEHQDWSRFVSFPYGCGLWLWLAQLCVSHPCPLMTKATGPFQLNTAVK